MPVNTGNRSQSLRKFVWSSDKTPSAQDIGEALRDLWQTIRLLSQFRLAALKNQVYAPPFYLNIATQPSSVCILGCVVSKSRDAVVGAATEWGWTGTQVRIDAIYGSRLGGLYPAELTQGTAYDITFLMVA